MLSERADEKHLRKDPENNGTVCRADDTIAAVSTAPSAAGIGVIRVSGPQALTVCDDLFYGAVSVRDMPANTFRYGTIREDGCVIDEAILLVFRAPHSYTGENVAEIQCHGGMLVLERILNALFRRGVRPAEPGEFSRRAFLNGRMDLSQAEAVMEIIRAQNERMLQNAQQQLQGVWGTQIRRIREEMLLEMAFIEASLDDPEHYSLEQYTHRLGQCCHSWLQWIGEKIRSAGDGQRLREGVFTAIIGLPNVGKSSLLNALAGRERAIVTDIAGTTRDLIEETVNISDVTLRLVDTAGLRQTEDRIEQIGVLRSRETMEQAQLVLCMVDASAPLSEDERQLLSELDPQRTILIANKCDRKTQIREEQLRGLFGGEVCFLSARTGKGLPELCRCIRTRVYSSSALSDHEYVVTQPRHLSLLQSAEKSLKLVEEAIRAGMPEDLLMIDLTDAWSALGKILGEAVDDELANAVFANFCIGK